MIRRDSQVTVTDLFCGAGGWTEGAEQAGALVRYGVNHWPRACETYALNHVNAKVDCNDISSTNPGRYPRTDILIASPECTTHSPAGGSRPRRSLLAEDDPALEAELARIERSRVTMLDVIRFAEHHRYDAIIVENVVEVRRWELFDWWLRGLMNLGYDHETVYMNSMVAWPTPQSRDRIYIVFWRRGNTRPDLRFDVAAWCPRCERNVSGVQSWKDTTRPWGKYRTQYVYRCPVCATAAWPYAFPAASAIDWSLPAPRIGDRARPLAAATMRRIRAGLERFGPAAIVTAAGNTYEYGAYRRVYSPDEPMPTQATTIQHGLVVDTLFGGDGHVRPTGEPLASQTARQSMALVVDTQHAVTNRTRARHAATETIGTQAAAPHHALVVPLRAHTRPVRADRSAMPTVAAGGNHHALLVPAGGTWNDEARPTDEPMRARTSRDNEALVTMPFIDVGRGGPDENRQTGVDEPLSTITTTGTHHRLVTPPGFVMANRANNVPRGFAEPLAPVATGNHHYLVMRNNDGARLTGVDEPVGTLTGAGHQSLLDVPFLTDYHGQGGAQPVTQPMGVVDTRDRRALVMPELDVDDCGFRMLEPHEIKAAMAFPSSYVITGNKREQVKQCGNAVTPPVSATILPRVIASLMGREV